MLHCIYIKKCSNERIKGAPVFHFLRGKNQPNYGAGTSGLVNVCKYKLTLVCVHYRQQHISKHSNTRRHMSVY